MDKEQQFQQTISELMKLHGISPSRVYELLSTMEEFYEDRTDHPYSEDF
jgi:DNA-binding IclR family transcriptional regulator